MNVMTRDQIASELETLPGWHHRGNAIEKRFDRGDFDGSMRFVNAIAVEANAQNHHPDLALSWNHVTVTLCSHDAGGVTKRDFALAATIERLAQAA